MRHSDTEAYSSRGARENQSEQREDLGTRFSANQMMRTEIAQLMETLRCKLFYMLVYGNGYR